MPSMSIDKAKRPKRESKRPARRPKQKPESIWDKIAAIGETITPVDLAKIPTDGARNLHHYLHGAPKEPGS